MNEKAQTPQSTQLSAQLWHKWLCHSCVLCDTKSLANFSRLNILKVLFRTGPIMGRIQWKSMKNWIVHV